MKPDASSLRSALCLLYHKSRSYFVWRNEMKKKTHIWRKRFLFIFLVFNTALRLGTVRELYIIYFDDITALCSIYYDYYFLYLFEWLLDASYDGIYVWLWITMILFHCSIHHCQLAVAYWLLGCCYFSVHFLLLSYSSSSSTSPTPFQMKTKNLLCVRTTNWFTATLFCSV